MKLLHPGLYFLGMLFILIAGSVSFYQRHINVITPDTDIREWLAAHPFRYNFPGFIGRLHMFPMIKDPYNGVELPTGELWAAPSSWYSLNIDTFTRSFFNLRKYLGAMNQDWTVEHGQLRLLLSGVGYCYRGVDPGVWESIRDDMLSQKSGLPESCGEYLKLKIALACNLLFTGENVPLLLETVDELCEEKCLTGHSCDQVEFSDPYSRFRAELTAFTYLRYGEIDNCIGQHTHESCLFPLENTAIHRKPLGSQKAIRFYEIQLTREPENYSARWLLNLAYMTLGKYPDGVPEQWRIPPEVFQSEYELPEPFLNIAGYLGVDFFSGVGTTIFEDFNQDNLLDIFACAGTYYEESRVWLSRADGTFQELDNVQSGIQGVVGGFACKHGDFDNDGHVDIILLRAGWTNVDHPKSLLKNLGNGTFHDVTFKSLNPINLGASHSADFGDINNDGLLDIYVSNENNNNELFLNLGDSKFVDIGKQSGVRDCHLSKTVGFADFNNDGWLDLYVSNSGHQNKLFRNNGRPNNPKNLLDGWSFTEIGLSAGVQEPALSFPFAWFDINQDGWLDIVNIGHVVECPAAIYNSYSSCDYWSKDFVEKEWGTSSGLSAKTPRVYLNNHDETFTDITRLSPKLKDLVMGMAMNFGDFDNDGYEDIYVGTGQVDLRALLPNRLFKNMGNGTFFDVTSSAKVGHLQKGHGISFGDFDNDGDLDILANIGGAWHTDKFHNALFLNPGFEGHHFLKIKLLGVQENKKAIGARVKIFLKNEDGSDRVVYRTVTSGSGYGANPYAVHAGLGRAASISRVEIFWPRARKTQVLENPPLDTFLFVTEGKPGFEILSVPTFHYDLEKVRNHHTDHHDCFLMN